MIYRSILWVGLGLLLLGMGTAPKRLAWNADEPIHWSDFQGMPDMTNGFAASSSTGLSQAYELDGQGYLNAAGTTITAHFYPEFSWYRVKDSTFYLLKHERAHFDITEVHARKLRKRIVEYTFTANSQIEIKQLYHQVEKERQAMQAQFDKETNHSRDKIQEAIWQKRIRKLLEEYWVYTS